EKAARKILRGKNQGWANKATMITDEAVALFSEDPFHFFSSHHGDVFEQYDNEELLDELGIELSSEYEFNEDLIKGEEGVQLLSNSFGFGSLQELPDQMAELLAEYPNVISLDFDCITTLSDLAAASLGRTKGELRFGKPLCLSDGGWKALAMHTGRLYLQGQEVLSEKAAEALAGHEGHLAFADLGIISDRAIESLAKHVGSLDLLATSWLKSPGTEEGLSKTAVMTLSKKKGLISGKDPKEWARCYLEELEE
ncbi:hypothetical protein N9Z22_01155, partial [bacterium]|nr:hypothetical protein [bacterium]